MERARRLVPADAVLHYGEDFPRPRQGREVVVLLPFLMVGIAPPLSAFLLEVLEAYRIHLVHLTPNSIVILAVFAYACEMFFEVRPSVELFRYFFHLNTTSSRPPAPGVPPQPRTVGVATSGSNRSTATSSSTRRPRVDGTSGSISGCSWRLPELPPASGSPPVRRNATTIGAFRPH
ncbi:uncharacterized protein C2845_PM01G42910 [Panicum miliaceum]|uniref:Transposase (putative) gypsy type domain-containing protein n=1 Tax=Panicum miliaceum TaxID=4540 RepID=A0A3L6TTZ5_PANMI|nr:uncharacterized protein C2845_PM01G42910 [Panicum miliaceum]